MALGLTLPANIPGVSKIMDKLDATKAKFLAVPANVRAAKDRLAKARLLLNKNGNILDSVNREAQNIDTALSVLNSQWQTAAERFQMVDDMRKDNKLVTLDGLNIASQLVTSAGYVIANSDKAVAAVDGFAMKYLTPAQREQINVTSTGASNGATTLLMPIALVGAAFLFLRRGR